MNFQRWLKLGAMFFFLLWLAGITWWQVSLQAEQKKTPPVAKVGPKFVIYPYLQFPTKTSIKIMWECDVACTGAVEFDEPKVVVNDPKTKKPIPMVMDRKATTKAATELQEVELTELKPGQKYMYRVKVEDASGNKLESELLTLMTAVEPDQAWSFCTIGDTQRNPQMTGKIANLMWERRPNFAIHCGDVVDEGPDKKQWTDDLFKPATQLLRRVAVLPTLGNHEKNHEFYYKYFALPAPKYHYKFTYGNADFFSIDTNNHRKLAPGSEQYQWLDEELGKSKATWKIVFHHHPVFSSDDDDFGNSWKGKNGDGEPRIKPLITLYEKHHVDFVFNGHVHAYERTWPLRDKKIDRKNGTTYITTGGGGGNLENFTPTPHWFKAEQRMNFHYCYITVFGNEWNLKAFDHEGRLFDTYTKVKE